MSRAKETLHPGRVLATEYLEPREISGNALSVALGVPSNRINDILRGRRGISADTALRLARYFTGTSPRYWLELQSAYDLDVATRENGKLIAKEVVPAR